jgi:long-chain acyl-CoA synthetase
MNETARARTRWPVMSIAQAHQLLTASGSTFEMEEVSIAGRPTRAWKNGPKSLADMWLAAAAHGARTFLVHGEDRVTFDAFRRASLAFALHLIERGVRKGDRVALVMRNQTQWPVVFYGAALTGAIVTPLNAWWSAAELAFGLRQSGAAVAVLDEERYRRTREMLGDCPALRTVIVSGLEHQLPEGVTALEAIIGAPATWAELPAAGAPPVALSPDDDATIFYTSGTSGKPKGALASHRAVTTPVFASLLSQARGFLRRGEAPPQPGPNDPQKKYLLAIPLFHVTGCFSAMNVAVAIGAMLIIMRKWDSDLALDLIEREGVTSVGGVPTIAWQLLEHPDRARYDLGTIDTVNYGGAPAAPELVRRLAETFPQAQIGSGWGMTETCATFTHHLGEDYLHRPDSCGPVTPVAEMKVVDGSGRSLPADAVGELWVRGPHVVGGYWDMPEATAASFADGWMKTGDLARIDAEGFCSIVDRIKDVIIRGGENIYSVEVEDVLYQHPAIMDAALVPIPHPTLGEEAGAVVTLKPGRDASEDELKAHVAAHLATFKIPARIILWHEPLPRNANGKILKKDLRSLFQPTTGSTPAPASAPQSQAS